MLAILRGFPLVEKSQYGHSSLRGDQVAPATAVQQ